MSLENRLLKILPDLSAAGFGAWALGGEYWGPQNHSDSIKALHRALALGVNHFDSAPVYGKGRSEQIIGQQMKKIRSRVYLASKAFYTTPRQMEDSLDTSLKRMLTDYLDIFYIHWPRSDADMRPGMEMLEARRREGRIRAIGVSNFSLEQMKQLEEAGTVDVFQGGYNLFWTGLEQSLLPYLRSRGIAFVPYGVLAQGILTDRGQEHLQADHPGFRHKMVLYNPQLRGFIANSLNRMSDACRREGISLERAAAAYAARRTGAVSVLLGCRNRAQAEKNFAAPQPELSAELTALFDGLSREAGEKIPAAANMFNHES